MTDKLTPKQRQIFNFILREIKRFGYPPTVRSIGLRFGISSPNGVIGHLNALEKKGMIVRESIVARGIRLVNHGVCPYCGQAMRKKAKTKMGI